MVRLSKKSNNMWVRKGRSILKSKGKEKGITLIALVITIIVLLILAGVTIAMITGEDGILRKASEAADATKKATVREQVQAEVLGSYDNRANFDINKFKENVKKVFGLTDAEIKNDESINGVQFEVNGLDVKVTGQGEVLLEGEKAKYPVQPTEPSTSSGDSEQADPPAKIEETAQTLKEKLKDINGESVIGKKVTGLGEVDTGVANNYEWEIFDVVDDHIYLIATDYIKTEDCPNGKGRK